MEQRVVRREELLKGFTGIKMEVRDGSAIVDKMARDMEELLTRRAKAVEDIVRRAEEIATPKTPAPENYTFDYSVVSHFAYFMLEVTSNYFFHVR